MNEYRVYCGELYERVAADSPGSAASQALARSAVLSPARQLDAVARVELAGQSSGAPPSGALPVAWLVNVEKGA